MMNIKKSLYICSFSFMMNYSAYAGLVFLQSSMNIEDGLGAASLFTIYITSSVSTIFFVPFLIDFAGAKTAIVLGEVGITAFTVANFYPSWYTMIPVAIFHGLTESASWAGAAVYVTHLGEKYWKQKCRLRGQARTSHKPESYVYRFISIFYVFVYLSQVFGNALVCCVLSGLKDVKIMDVSSSSSAPYSGNISIQILGNNTDTSAELAAANASDSWELCGAQECHSKFNFGEETEALQKYLPNQASVYLLLSIFLVVQFIFVSVHAFALPRIPTKFEIFDKENGDMTSNKEDEDPIMMKGIPVHSHRIQNAVTSELKETLWHIVSPLHLLVFPLIFYYGVFIAFTVTEFTRAYVSCTVGVEQLGLVMVVYGLTSMATSLFSAKLLPLLGRNIMYSIVAFMHISIYLVCLLWEPNPATTWVIYLIAGSLGSCDGVITNTLQGMVAVYFQDRLGIAFSVKSCVTNLGIVAGTGLSTSLCVFVKIYILFILLGLSAVFYVGAETLYKKTTLKRSCKAQKSLR